MKYKRELIKGINKSIDKYFPIIFPILPKYKIIPEGISRIVMLDRYSQRDQELISLEKGNLVLTIVKFDPKFPSRGIGYIKKILKNNRVEIKLESEYIPLLDKHEFNEDGIIIRKFNEISKPLELYWEQIAMRVGHNLGKIEKSEIDKKKWSDIFSQDLKEMKILPAGRVLYGAGSDSEVTYFNCYVMPYILDSRGGIADHRKIVMEIMSRGGGVGTNGSTLRPRNAMAKSVGGTSSGAVSWLNDIANLTHLVEQGGSRRGAQMIMLADWHPDIIEFIISKMQKPNVLLWLMRNSKSQLIRKFAREKIRLVKLTDEAKSLYQTIFKNENNAFSDKQVKSASEKLKDGGTWEVVNPDFLTGSNISVAISDDFMKAVKGKKKWSLKFPDIENYNEEKKQWYDDNWHKYGDIREWSKLGFKLKTYYEIRAQDLWDLINFCSTYSAEPGVFFIDTANKYTNAKSYGQKVVATNPCGEQPLAPFSVCNLAAINLSKFVDRKKGEILYDDLEKTVRNCVRLQDNVIDATPYFLEPNKKQALGERRVGLGIMGLHDLLIWSGHSYGSKKCLKVIDKILKLICYTSYDESVELSKIKGSFPFMQDRDKFVSQGFATKLSNELKIKILKYGIRNSHLLTIAPTGTTGTLANVSTGLEPYFGFSYYRSGRLGKFIKVEAQIVKDYLKLFPKTDPNNLPKIFVNANELTPIQHANVQIAIQKWVDSSISKTVNAPEGFAVKDVEHMYMYLYDNGAKGGTLYVNGSRNSQVLSLDGENSKKIKSKEIISKKSIEAIKKIKNNAEKNNLRSDRQDREIGVSEGNICPNCLEGVVVVRGGCTECANCQSQLKCGL